MAEHKIQKRKTQHVDNGIQFQVYYESSNFRVCTVSRIKGIDAKTKNMFAEHVDPCQSLAIEIRDDSSYNSDKSSVYYLVVAFVRRLDDGKFFVEEVDGRVKALGFINKIRYHRAEKAALARIKLLNIKENKK